MKIELVAILAVTAPLASACEDADSGPTAEASLPLVGCQPGPRQVALFMGRDGDGTCVLFGLDEGQFGAFSKVEWWGFPNDEAESVMVGSDVIAQIHEHYGFSGARWVLERNEFVNLGWFSNRITGLRVIWGPKDCRDPNFLPGIGEVAVWRDDNFTSDCMVFMRDDWSVESGLQGHFTNLWHDGFEGWTASSMKIGPGTRVETFRGTYFRAGGEEFFGGPFGVQIASLRNTLLGNDALASMAVH